MRRTKLLILGLCCGLLIVMARCSSASRAQGGPDKSGQALEILYTRDIKGNAELCGCSPDQKGGLPRMATIFHDRAKPGTTTIKVDCGNYLPAVDDPVAPIHRPQILSGYKALGYDAINIGAVEAGYRLAELRKLAGEGLPLVSASIYDTANRPVFEPLRVTRKGGLKIAWIGLIGRSFSGEGFRVLPPEEALKKVQPQLAKEKADLVCVLGDFSVDEAVAVGQAAKGVHIILTAKDLKFAPRAEAFVAPAAGDYGSHIGQIRVKRNGEGFECEADLIALTRDVREDVAVMRTVKEAGEKARQALTISPHRADSMGDFVGATQCKACHDREHEIWEASQHSHAFNILTSQQADRRIDCVSCHVTGYRVSDAAYFAQHVGCESCHGPGKKHIEFYTAGKGQKVSMTAGKDSCLKCHQELNSPTFTFNYYWSKIQH